MTGSIGEPNAAQVFTKRIGVKGDLYAATLTAGLVLDGSHGTKLYLTPTAAHDVTMPALDLCVGVTYQITNAAVGDYALTLKDASGATITTIAQGEIGWVHCTGDAWQPLGRADLSSDAPNLGDRVCTAVLALPETGAGVADKALTLSLFRADGVTPIASVRAATIRVVSGGDIGNPLASGIATVSFSAATAGAILVSGGGFATVLTDTTGAFACTCSDSADEQAVAFVETPAAVDSLAHSCLIAPSAFVQTEWL